MATITSNSMTGANGLKSAICSCNRFSTMAQPRQAKAVADNTIPTFIQGLIPRKKPITHPTTGPVIQNGNYTNKNRLGIP